MKLTETELNELIRDLAPRLNVVVRELRELRASLEDSTSGEAYRLARARGVLEAVTDELANASTPIVLASAITRQS